ncbi:uncharacterized protein NECHADRAFT_82757 [Fusarium vanettenii 77-13-4]|uniref:Uncharacterized protein n=1 Tax=Fusarium vanettenii (strain ATCC MYA-4622 / CBS 123669 / FGSC 9596 / NRRL 45880 / 77-13-4) TaxID=660122 RepID=C7YWR5_FUSV7|nr:uncharacterized protein NECHADRAFT_82757 [Fusarium vanettenii 77-13-4]EEU43707.1 predicted protein [Fusarium vanettenii 77-13-4]
MARPPRRRPLRNKAKAKHFAPRYVKLSSLSSCSQRTDKINQSIGSHSQRANATIAAGQGHHVPHDAYVIPLPRLSHPQDATTPQPEAPSKRPHPISSHSDDHHESRPPQKRHCGRGDDTLGLFKSASPKVLSIPLPSGGSPLRIPIGPELPGDAIDSAQERLCHSSLPIMSRSLAKNLLEKHEPDMPVGSRGHTKSLFKSSGNEIAPRERLDGQKWQECETIPRRIINMKHGLFDGVLRHQPLSEPSKTSSNKENLVQNPKTATARILSLWFFLFACLLGAFIGGMVLHSHLAPEFPAVMWELNDHEPLHCSGDKIKICSWAEGPRQWIKKLGLDIKSRRPGSFD